MPPFGAWASSRAAILTPSPNMSSPSMTMSPRLMPMRNSTGRSDARLRLLIARWIATAHSTASTTLPNSTSAPSPIVFTMRPWRAATAGLNASIQIRRITAMVFVSPASIIRLYPATSATRIAARRRVISCSDIRCPLAECGICILLPPRICVQDNVGPSDHKAIGRNVRLGSATPRTDCQLSGMGGQALGRKCRDGP